MGTRAVEPFVATGQCFVVPMRDGRFGACQILGVNGEEAEVFALDLWSRRPPSLETLAKAKGLHVDHHSHRRHLLRFFVSGPPPPGFRLVGTLDPIECPAQECCTWSAWHGLGMQIQRQKWWDRVVPAAEKRRYDACAGPGQVAIEIGAGAEIRRSTSNLSIGPHEQADLRVDAKAPVAWSLLDALGQLIRLEYRGRDPVVLDYVRSRRLLTDFTWFGHGHQEIDLRGLGVHEFRTEARRKLMLRVDDDLEQLTLHGHRKGRTVHVVHPSEGEGLTLDQRECAEVPPTVGGLARLSELELASPQNVDVRRVARYPRLRALTVRGSFASVQHPAALRKLSELAELTLYDCYALPVAEFPAPEQLPALAHACFNGLRKTDARALREHWRAVPHLEIRGAKNDAWIAANADNPLRDWVDDDERFGQAACRAYAKAYRGAAGARTEADAQKVLRAFVVALNRLDARHGLIDTLRREQALEAYETLAGLTTVPSEDAFAWFDAERDF